MAAPPLNTFAGLSLSLDRMAERRDDDAWLATQAAAASARYLLLDGSGSAFLTRERDALRWLDASERSRLFAHLPATLLGLAHEQPHFLLVLDDDARVDELETVLDARRMGLREAGLLLHADEAGLFAYAKGLLHWHRETRHCARCGAPLRVISAGHRLQCSNPTCGRLHFPRTDTAMIVLVEHDGACLLGHQASWPDGRYSTLAGFVEPGEALEDAVRREVAEESGVIVGEVRYHSSQPWPMPASLMAAFTATARVPDIHLRDHELADARWFTPTQIATGLADGSLLTPTRLSVSYRLLADWLQLRAGLDLDELVKAAPVAP